MRIVRGMRPEIPVVVRTIDDKDVAGLKAAGATEVIPEVIEGSLLIAAETLVQAGVPMNKAILHVRATRAERCATPRCGISTSRGVKRNATRHASSWSGRNRGRARHRWSPHFAKPSFDVVKQVKIAAIDPDFERKVSSCP
jgi:hypothetical protein